MEEVDWSSLHKILSDTTRRNVLELLAEKEGLSYTEIMALLQITNTGRLNYHLKALGALVSKDDQGKYSLNERGKLAANMLKTFPERAPVDSLKSFVRWRLVESENLIISFIWIFVIVISLGLFWTGTAYVAGIGGPFAASVFLFLVAIVASVGLLQTKKK